jgi:alkanesulfonate monooxygenase SsuD/methylene tetrahydromethanopterin reductase-like flavin-dependent oxidoreductase (luciferase family)
VLLSDPERGVRVVSKPKQIRLAINLLASGRHNASWKTLDDPAGLSTDIDVFLQIARTAERGLLDGIFLADNHGGLNEESYKRPFRALDPSVLLAALATHTHHIGLVSTVPALYGNPATVARQIASLDHVSKGRAAWNIITSQHDHTLRIFGRQGRRVRDHRHAAVGVAAARGDRRRRGPLHLRQPGTAPPDRFPG